MSRRVLLLAVSAVFLSAVVVFLDDRAHGVPPKTPSPAMSTAPTPVAKPLAGGEETIRKALEQPASIECINTPLQEVVDYLQEKNGIPIVFDNKELQSVSIDPDKTPVTCKLSGISLRSALELVLDDLQLRATVHHEVLLITSATRADSEDFLVVKTYDVSDLLVPTADRPYTTSSLPGSPAYAGAALAAANAGYGIGCPLSMGATACAGRAGPAGRGGQMGNDAADYDSLIDMITSTVWPKSWDRNGGQGTIASQEQMLVVSQTREAHATIAALLADLHARRQATPTVAVELQWLWLDANRYEQLLGGAKPPAADAAARTIEPQVLDQLARKAPGFRGRVMCRSGQLTHVASGDRRSVIVSAIPVVDDQTAYMPLIDVPNLGVLAEVRPSVLPGGNSVLLDLESTVTRRGKPLPPVKLGATWPAHQVAQAPVQPPVQAPVPVAGQAPAPVNTGSVPPARMVPGGSASCEVDRLNVPTADIVATARVPLGKPVLLGAVTFAPADGAGLDKATDSPVQLCLIATTRIVAAEEPVKEEPNHKDTKTQR